MGPSVRVRRSVLLSVAFTALLLIIGASAFAIWRNATAAQLRVAALHNAHLESGNALSALRADVYLTAILTRDYLLDADPTQARQYADQFVKIRISTDDSFRILAALAQGDQEKAALGAPSPGSRDLPGSHPHRFGFNSSGEESPAVPNFSGRGCAAAKRSWRSPAKLSR